MRNTVKEQRLSNNLTQAQLAELVNVSRQTIISIESERYVPSVLLALKIAKALGKQVSELFVLERGD